MSLDIGAAADAYAKKMGQVRPRQFSNIVVSPQHQERLARAYEAAPEFDRNALPAFHAFREENKRQFDYLTNRLGVHVESTSHDPYQNAGELVHDLTHNRRLKVLSSASTGGHPLLPDDENDMFRAVHDAFGHAGTGRAFDRHGEEAAYQSHAAMFSPLARHALATETRGQNAYLIRRGSFPQQKVALLPGATRSAPPVSPRERSRLLLQARQFHTEHGL